MTIRTSQTNPLRIATVQVGEGAVGLTLCPGKQGESVYGAAWARDLTSDVEVIRQWGASVVVTLIERHEFGLLRVEGLPQAVEAAGLKWLWWPIADVSVPDARFDQAWSEEGARLCERVRGGERVLVHCRGGLGRAGMIAARILVELGEDPATAIERVRAVRPGAIETSEQEAWVLACNALPRG